MQNWLEKLKKAEKTCLVQDGQYVFFSFEEEIIYFKYKKKFIII